MRAFLPSVENGREAPARPGESLCPAGRLVEAVAGEGGLAARRDGHREVGQDQRVVCVAPASSRRGGPGSRQVVGGRRHLRVGIDRLA